MSLTYERIHELWEHENGAVQDFARAVEAEARREALEELIAAGFISNAYVIDAQEHINGKRT